MALNNNIALNRQNGVKLNRHSGDKKTMTIIGQMAIKNSNLSWWSGRVGVFYGTN
jgi:hypothetical protein